MLIATREAPQPRIQCLAAARTASRRTHRRHSPARLRQCATALLPRLALARHASSAARRFRARSSLHALHAAQLSEAPRCSVPCRAVIGATLAAAHRLRARLPAVRPAYRAIQRDAALPQRPAPPHSAPHVALAARTAVHRPSAARSCALPSRLPALIVSARNSSPSSRRHRAAPRAPVKPYGAGAG
jgi:hypothetical protein